MEKKLAMFEKSILTNCGLHNTEYEGTYGLYSVM